MPVTLQDLKNDLKEYAYKTLTGGDDNAGELALKKARTWFKGKLAPCRIPLDEEDETNRQILLARAQYELYAFAQNEEVARDKREDAMELLRSVYGPCVDGTGYERGGERESSPAGAVKTPERKRYP